MFPSTHHTLLNKAIRGEEGQLNRLLEVFAPAIGTLKEECASGGREVRFAIFEAYDLAEETRPSYEEVALRYHVPVTTVTNHMAWAWKELRRLVQR